MSAANYRVYCLTEKRYIYTYSATAPTTCPNNGSHAIDSNRVFGIHDRGRRYDATTSPTVNDDESQGCMTGSRWLDVSNNKEYVCLDGTAGAAVWKDTTVVLANIGNAEIASGAAIDATKIADGSVTSTEFQYLGAVSSDIQTQLNGKAGSSHNHAAGDVTTGTFSDARIAESNVTQHEAAITIGNLTGAPSGSVVGATDAQTLTSKTINADNNTVSNIANAEIKAAAAIDATKIANGSVTNAEFQYLGAVTSDIQSQLNGKSSSGHTHVATDVTDFSTAADARIAAQRGAADGLASLDSGGKVPASQLNLDSVDYQGTWNANTNIPSLADGVGTKGYYYVVSVAGTTDIDGVTDWKVGDWIIFNGTVWEKSDHTDQVTSVAGKQGAVTLAAGDIASGTFANARIAESNVTQHEGAITISNLSGAPSGTVVGTTDSQTLTNKTINADNNTVSNIANAEIKAAAAIDATKIANGSVTNTEFQYLNAVTSNVQTQLNGKASSSHNHAAGDITSGTFANARISQSSVTQHVSALNHDSLSGFVSNEHINHSSVSINAGEGLSGGGNITSSRTIDIDIDSLPADSTPDGAADYVVTYDDNASSHKKVLLNNLPSTADFTDGGEVGGADRTIGNTDAYALGIKTNDVERVRVESDGDVGIGGSAMTDYRLTVCNSANKNGFAVCAGENSGDISFHIADQDDTFQIMELEANNGYVTFGKTYAQTLSDNGVVYGIDIQHSGAASDINTQNGVYRIGGNQVMHNTHYQYASSEGESSTTSTTLQTKTTLTTSSLPSGTYRLGYCFELSNASNGVLSEVEVKLDGSIVAISTFEADNDYHSLSGFIHQSLSGVITATIKHRVRTYGTSKIRRARLELQRVS